MLGEKPENGPVMWRGNGGLPGHPVIDVGIALLQEGLVRDELLLGQGVDMGVGEASEQEVGFPGSPVPASEFQAAPARRNVHGSSTWKVQNRVMAADARYRTE